MVPTLSFTRQYPFQITGSDLEFKKHKTNKQTNKTQMALRIGPDVALYNISQ